MKILSLVILLISGCASYNHHQIVAKNAAAEREAGIPEYGGKPRDKSAEGAAHGLLWWVGSNKVKELLTK